jgi:hypothetical protein
MPGKPVRLDFNINKITLKGEHYNLPLFTKALIRFSKVVLAEKKRVLVLYPSFYCSAVPLLLISSYYSLLATNKRPKILLITNRKETALEYKAFGNEQGYPFVDFIYSGILTKKGTFNRIKPIGSNKGKLSGRIKEEGSSVFISNFGRESLGEYDIIFVENAQLLAKQRYNGCLRLLTNSKNPVIAVQTSPNLHAMTMLQKKLNCLIWGWSEELARDDLLAVCKLKNTLEPEARFPELKFQALPIDNYHNFLVLSRNAFLKAIRLRANLRNESENVSRVFFNLSWLLKRCQNLVVSLSDVEKIEIENNLIPTRSRISMIRAAINKLPERIGEKLELENVLSLSEAALQNPPTKGKEIENYLSSRVACCIVTTDKVQQESLQRRFPKFSSGFHYYEDTPKDSRTYAFVLGLTGSVEKDYKILKWSNADTVTICGYSFETEFLKRLQFNRQQLELKLGNRANVLKSLNLGRYSQV